VIRALAQANYADALRWLLYSSVVADLQDPPPGLVLRVGPGPDSGRIPDLDHFLSPRMRLVLGPGWEEWMGSVFLVSSMSQY